MINKYLHNKITINNKEMTDKPDSISQHFTI